MSGFIRLDPALVAACADALIQKYDTLGSSRYGYSSDAYHQVEAREVAETVLQRAAEEASRVKAR